MDSALAQYELMTGKSIVSKPAFKVTCDDGFWALAESIDGGTRIQVSTGVVHAIDKLWRDAWMAPILFTKQGNRTRNYRDIEHNPVGLADVSIMWLLLHELMHVALEHLDILGGAHLVGTKATNRVPLHADRSQSGTLIQKLPKEDMPFLAHCLEMQADSEATDVLLEAYSDEQWDELRARTASIFVVMVLVEKEHRKTTDRNGTHPKSTTRFFTLMGHLFQMWLYPVAHLEPDQISPRLQTSEKPDPEKFELYAEQVLVPSINDAVIIAAAGEARLILSDMGDHAAIFHDISKIQYTDDLSPDILKTEAAKEWLRLIPINERIMTLIRLREKP